MTNARSACAALLALLACASPAVRAADRPSGDDSGRPAPAGGPAAEEKDSPASAWAASDDGKVSLRIVAAHGPIGADEPVWVLAELRNDSDETLAVLKPFGDRYKAEAAGFEIVGPNGKVRYEGPEPDYVLGADAFTLLPPGRPLLESSSVDALQEWLPLTPQNHPGLSEPGRYTIRYTYRATPGDQEMAQQSRRFVGRERIWTGEIRSGAVTVTKAKRPHDGDNAPAVTVRIASDEYRFTLAEAAAGVRFDYDVAVPEDLDRVVPHPQDAGGASAPGPSGLMPFETLSGNGQSYCLCDVGLGQPDQRPRRIERGTYPHSFVWDGRNWGGPSDTSAPKGGPFPPGTYTLQIRVRGEIDTPEGRKPYDVSDTAKVVLTP